MKKITAILTSALLTFSALSAYPAQSMQPYYDSIRSETVHELNYDLYHLSADQISAIEQKETAQNKGSFRNFYTNYNLLGLYVPMYQGREMIFKNGASLYTHDLYLQPNIYLSAPTEEDFSYMTVMYPLALAVTENAGIIIPETDTMTVLRSLIEGSGGDSSMLAKYREEDISLADRQVRAAISTPDTDRRTFVTFIYDAALITVALNTSDLTVLSDLTFRPEKKIPNSKVTGDADGNGKLTVADIVALKKWLTGEGTLTNWQMMDVCPDGRIDIFDYCLLIQKLTKKQNSDPHAPTEPTDTMNIEVRSKEEYLALKKAAAGDDENFMEYLAETGIGRGINSLDEARGFTDFMDDLPLPDIGCGDITWISRIKGTNWETPTAKPDDTSITMKYTTTDTACITIKINGEQEWLRLEYLPAEQNIEAAVEKTAKSDPDTELLTEYVGDPSLGIKLRGESCKKLEGGGQLYTWHTDYNGMYIRAVYRTPQDENLIRSDFMPSIRLTNIEGFSK